MPKYHNRLHSAKGIKEKLNQLHLRVMIGVAFWCKTKTTKIILSEEHSEYKWLSPEDALKFVTRRIVVSNIT